MSYYVIHFECWSEETKSMQPACRPSGPEPHCRNLFVSADPAEVNCSRCKRFMERKAS